MIMMMWLPNWTKWYRKKHWHFPMNNNVIEMCGMGRETNKRELIMEWKMMWKTVTVNTLGREILKMEQKCIFHFRHTGKKNEKWSFFESIYAKARLGFHFLFNFLSFSVSILRKIETKWNRNWWKNEWKMNKKCQPWTTLFHNNLYNPHYQPGNT